MLNSNIILRLFPAWGRYEIMTGKLHRQNRYDPKDINPTPNPSQRYWKRSNKRNKDRGGGGAVRLLIPIIELEKVCYEYEYHLILFLSYECNNNLQNKKN